MILYCNFEELRALTFGAEMVLSGPGAAPEAAVAAPAEAIGLIELLLPRLHGDLSVTTLAEQRQVEKAVAVICEELLARMDEKILAYSPGSEEAVVTYFDYGHARTVLDRVERIGAEMSAIIELISGEAPTEQTARSVTFAD